MDVLDRVFTTFSNLDRDFKKSTKSRTEFITDKFGGDIDIGAMIILDAISSSTGDETPDDIRKLTFVKHIIAGVKENKDVLDTLPDFSFSGNDLYTRLISVLDTSYSEGTGVSVISQAELHKKYSGVVHFVSTPKGTKFVPFESCKVVHVYNDNMLGILSTMRGGEHLRRDTYHTIRGVINPEELTRSQVTKALKR